MKTQNLILFAALGLLFSCAGNSPETETTNEENQVAVDSLIALSAFEEFASYVASLDRVVENVDSAFAKYENLKTDFSTEEKDSAFFVIRDYMLEFEISEDEFGDYSSNAISKIEKKYTKSGFDVLSGEGYYWPVPNNQFLQQKFKKDISEELDDYLDLLKKVEIQITSDAGLIITWAELADMILLCEEFLTENTETKYSSLVMSLYMERLHFLMWGLDNTPIIDLWSEEEVKQLDPDVSAVYQKLIADTKYKTGKIIADHLTWLESKNFKYLESDYLSEVEVRMYLGLE